MRQAKRIGLLTWIKLNEPNSDHVADRLPFLPNVPLHVPQVFIRILCISEVNRATHILSQGRRPLQLWDPGMAVAIEAMPPHRSEHTLRPFLSLR